MKPARWLLYGAYGHAGRRIAHEAVRRGHRPLLAGRDGKRLRSLAAELELDCVEAEVGALRGILSDLEEGSAVVNAAGPFVRTAELVVEACLDTRLHYLDITGEVPVLEELFRKDGRARARGVSVVPAVGFAVVPTDALACRLKEAVPTAMRIEMAFAGVGRPSAGTLSTMLEHLPNGALRRRGGVLIRRQLGEDPRMIPFPDASRYAIPVSWGDLSTVYRSTEIRDILTYMAISRRRGRWLRRTAPTLRTLLSTKGLRRVAIRTASALVRAPREEERLGGRARIWARAEAPDGRSSWGTVETMDGQRFTTLASVLAVERVLAGIEPGVLTPTQAFGTGFLEEIPETTVSGPHRGGVPPATAR